MKYTFSFLALVLLSPLSVAEEIDIKTLKFEARVLKQVTPKWLATLKVEKAEQLRHLQQLERDNDFPPGTFRIKWIIESMAGERNVKNKHGFRGHFQYGDYEWDTYCHDGSPFKFKDAAACLPKFLNAYFAKAKKYMPKGTQPARNNMTPMDWYHLHQQGYRGASEQYASAVLGKAMTPSVKGNLLNNIPPVYKTVFAGIQSDKTMAQMYYKMWDTEAFRIWSAIKFADE